MKRITDEEIEHESNFYLKAYIKLNEHFEQMYTDTSNKSARFQEIYEERAMTDPDIDAYEGCCSEEACDRYILKDLYDDYKMNETLLMLATNKVNMLHVAKWSLTQPVIRSFNDDSHQGFFVRSTIANHYNEFEKMILDNGVEVENGECLVGLAISITTCYVMEKASNQYDAYALWLSENWNYFEQCVLPNKDDTVWLPDSYKLDEEIERYPTLSMAWELETTTNPK